AMAPADPGSQRTVLHIDLAAGPRLTAAAHRHLMSGVPRRTPRSPSCAAPLAARMAAGYHLPWRVWQPPTRPEVGSDTQISPLHQRLTPHPQANPCYAHE